MDTYKLSRLSLIILSVLVMSVLLPRLFWLVATTAEKRPVANYSCILNEYVYLQKNESGKTEYHSASGKTLSKSAYQQALPFMYFRTLYTQNKMPQYINGVEVDAHSINMTNFFVNVPEKAFDLPEPWVYPIFRGDGIEEKIVLDTLFLQKRSRELIVLDSKSNQKINNLSEALNLQLNTHHFKHPANIIATNASLRKQSNNGFLLTDAANHLFSLKFEKGEPLVKVVRIPRNLLINHIYPVEIRSREFSNIIIDDKNKVYLLLDVNHELKQIPANFYHPQKSHMRIQGNLFHKELVVINDDALYSTTIDNDFNTVDYFEYKLQQNTQTKFGKIAKYLFPFELSHKENNKSYTRLHLRDPKPHILVLNVILVGLLLLLRMVFKHDILGRSKALLVSNLILVFIFGIFALPACLLLPSETP